MWKERKQKLSENKDSTISKTSDSNIGRDDQGSFQEESIADDYLKGQTSEASNVSVQSDKNTYNYYEYC